MPYPKLLSTEAILSTAVRMLEEESSAGLSLRAVAATLGVRAPSLYRHFQDKGDLASALAREILRQMHRELESAAEVANAQGRLIAVADAYLQFVQKHPRLYFYVFEGRVQGAYGSKEGKAVWNLLLDAVSEVTGKKDDTTSTVALWSFLHGYASLEQAGGFGASGPQGALQVGLSSFVSHAKQPAPNVLQRIGSDRSSGEKPVRMK